MLFFRLEEPVRACARRDHWLESFPWQTWGTGESLCPQRSLAWVFSVADLRNRWKFVPTEIIGLSLFRGTAAGRQYLGWNKPSFKGDAMDPSKGGSGTDGHRPKVQHYIPSFTGDNDEHKISPDVNDVCKDCKQYYTFSRCKYQRLSLSHSIDQIHVNCQRISFHFWCGEKYCILATFENHNLQAYNLQFEILWFIYGGFGCEVFLIAVDCWSWRQTLVTRMQSYIRSLW